MTELTTMPNIGKVLADRLTQAKIASSDKLKKIGSKAAFLKVKAIHPDACINHLFAIEGAIQNIRWHYLSDDVKSDLKAFYDEL